MVDLRAYQQELLQQAEARLWTPEARVMLQLPTGGGKTHIAGALLRRWLREGRKAVWLTHRTELADQTCGMLARAGVSAIALKTWQSGNDAPSVPNGAVILMAQTVGRRTNQMEIWGKYDEGDLLVIDEAHHAAADGWERAINQWPGRIVGLTATPWRLSKTEGFDHLFRELHCGPQVSELQSGGWLCQARVLMPSPEEIIRGGAINAIGDYSELGIEQANRDRPDIMTAGALRFWQFHAAERQTIIYAISQDHARNLTAEFNDAGIPSAMMLSDTLPQERAEAIDFFGNGKLQVLVNVAVATEGFDLPNASCVVITRPTMSLTLYLQMMGRGLRPKSDGGNCLILDLAGNTQVHGLPEENRRWTLAPRGSNSDGDAPVIRCEKCDGVSPAASHTCLFCETLFGKDCPRCGAWRAWNRWGYENHCSSLHELVCDRCHFDAHIKAQLPVTDELRRLTAMEPDLDTALRNLLKEERLRTGSADEEHMTELRSRIAEREEALASDHLLQSFKKHIAALPEEARPTSELDEYRLFPEWENSLKQELTGWEEELSKLGSKTPDKRLIYNNARERVLKALEAQATAFGLVPQPQSRRKAFDREQKSESRGPVSSERIGWMTFAELGDWGRIEPTKGTAIRPACFKDPQGKEFSVANWADLFFNIAWWLVDAELLTGPFTLGTMTKRRLIHTEPIHPDGREFGWSRQLPNGLFLECKWGAKAIARLSGQLLGEFGQDPSQFQVQLA